jgi:hypothetical protein
MRVSIVFIFLASLVLVTAPLQARPIGEGVMSDVRVFTGDECDPELAVIEMNIPVRYISHFPRSEGSQVRIRIRPLAVSAFDAESLIERSTLTPRFRRQVLLLDATYEGDITGGPFISLRFSETINYQVFQGDDYRSIRIIMRAVNTNCPH